MPNRTYTAAFLCESIAAQGRFPANYLEVYPCGMRLATTWNLEAGMEVELGVSCEGCCRSIRGVVVECECLDQSRALYDITMFFTEAPCCEFQHLLHLILPEGVEEDA